MKKYKDFRKNNEQLLLKYNSVKFSDDFYNTYENSDWDIDGMKLVFIKKINDFIEFYNKYNPDGARIINGRDTYKEAKLVYDDIINGNIDIDKALHDPDNVLKNIIQLMHLDEYKLKNK